MFDNNNPRYINISGVVKLFVAMSKRKRLIELNTDLLLPENEIITGNNIEILKTFPDNSVPLIITSPNYNNYRNIRTDKSKKDYWDKTNIVYKGECTDNEPEEIYQQKQIVIINEMVRVLKPDGVIVYNHKDRYDKFTYISPMEWIEKSNAVKYQPIIWDRGGPGGLQNPCRFYRTYEYLYILSKSRKQSKWNKKAAKYGDIWRIQPAKTTKKYDHAVPFPGELVRRCVLAFTNEGDIVLDPYNGSGTTTKVAYDLNRKYIGIDIYDGYCKTAQKRIEEEEPFEWFNPKYDILNEHTSYHNIVQKIK